MLVLVHFLNMTECGCSWTTVFSHTLHHVHLTQTPNRPWLHNPIESAAITITCKSF